jgi:membrane-associated phospholipid phosphatase
MSDALQWGLDLIVSIQEFRGPLLDDIFRAITFLGEEEFFLLFIPLIFWCVNVGMGLRITVLLMLSGCLNVDLKDLFQQPRPFEYDASVKVIDEVGYGLPSAHAQLSVVMWGMLASWIRKSWAWVVAVVLMLLVGSSRIYLGVHFPTQVLAGWSLGIVTLALYLGLHASIEKWLLELRLGQQIVLALVAPGALFLIHPVDDSAAATAILASMGVGLALGRGRVTWSAEGPWRQRAARFVVGVVGIFVLRLGLKAVFPAEGEAFYLLFRFVRYSLVGLWIVLGAPWLFGFLRLTPKVAEPAR